MKRREFMTLLAGAAAGSSAFCSVTWPLAARAQQPSAPAAGFPNKTMRIIVPFTPGGSNDVVAREIATGLQASLNQTAVVENKPGGGGNIAYSYVAKSPPDGHVMLIAPASFTMGPHLSRNPVYNPVTDFAAINLVADVPFVMVVPASLPVRTVKDFVELAREFAEQIELRLGWCRHAAASRRRTLQDARRRGSGPCAVPRRHGGPAGPGGRTHRHVHRRRQFAAAADPRGQPACPCRDQSGPHRLAARCSHIVRGRVSRIRGGLRGRAGGAGRHAIRHHRARSTARSRPSSPRPASTNAWR